MRLQFLARLIDAANGLVRYYPLLTRDPAFAEPVKTNAALALRKVIVNHSEWDAETFYVLKSWLNSGIRRGQLRQSTLMASIGFTEDLLKHWVCLPRLKHKE